MKSIFILFSLLSSLSFAADSVSNVEGQIDLATLKVEAIKEEIATDSQPSTCFSLGSLKSTLGELTDHAIKLMEEIDSGKKVFKIAGQAKVLGDSTLGFCTKDASNTYSGNGININRVKYQNTKSLRARLDQIKNKVNLADETLRSEL